MKALTKSHLCFSLLLINLISAQPALAGVFGSGNSSDLSLQLQFAKTNAVTFIKMINADQFQQIYTDEKVSDFYRSCRQTLFLSSLKTEFDIVKDIPDGGQFHAVMRRVGNKIQVSRTMMESMAKQGLFTAQTLTAYIIHEVGHDCVYQGKKTGDDMDPILDKLGEGLVQVASSQALSLYRSIDFIDKVKSNEMITFLNLPADVRQQISRKYLDYVGDWIYTKNKPVNVCMERPAPASQFFASFDTSLFLGWSSVDMGDEATQLAEALLKPSYKTKGLSYANGTTISPLPTTITCQIATVNSIDASQCVLNIFWNEVPAGSSVRNKRVEMRFTMDVTGDFELQKIKVTGNQ